MQALSKIMRMSVCARKLLPKLFQHFDNFSWNDKKLCGLDWWAWDYLDLPYAEESRWIPKFKSFGMMINSRLWALRPKTTEPHDGQHSIGGALSTDWFLLISIDFYWFLLISIDLLTLPVPFPAISSSGPDQGCARTSGTL